ncbi:MAG: TonB family protein, partial [Acidobacteria bacterium]|nr:TonB family protein [Acidobacteriota bacterium]
MKRQFLLIVSVVLFGASIAAAQTMPAPVKQISAGVVNGKAVNLAKPEYPAAARAVNAEGAVNVRVVIDENGDVASATAVSGHPLLRQAAEQAARASKFNPTLLSGQAVKVTGVVVYNFATAKTSNWFQVGMLLATLEKMPTLRYFDANVVASMIPADWTAEKQQLQRLN